MDVIICVNHTKMDGSSIVVNATIFNDNLNEFRFNINNGEWIYVDRVCNTNKTKDVVFLGLNQGVSHNVICHAKKDEEWIYVGNIITVTHTNEVDTSIENLEIPYTYSSPNTTVEIKVMEVVLR